MAHGRQSYLPVRLNRAQCRGVCFNYKASGDRCIGTLSAGIICSVHFRRRALSQRITLLLTFEVDWSILEMKRDKRGESCLRDIECVRPSPRYEIARSQCIAISKTPRLSSASDPRQRRYFTWRQFHALFFFLATKNVDAFDISSRPRLICEFYLLEYFILTFNFMFAPLKVKRPRAHG